MDRHDTRYLSSVTMAANVVVPRFFPGASPPFPSCRRLLVEDVFGAAARRGDLEILIGQVGHDAVCRVPVPVQFGGFPGPILTGTRRT